MTSVTLRNLGAIAGTALYADLSLTLQNGDRVGVVAGNGGGKTTLLNAIAGVGEPTSGEIVRSRGLRFGYVEQDIPARLMPLSLREAVAEALPPADRLTDAWRIEVVLDEFETPQPLRDRTVAELSGGWQRLMLVARVWVTEPDALLLDEPTNHLDLSKIFQLEGWLSRSTQGALVVIASHDRDFLDATTNRTLFLRPRDSRYFALPYSAARQALEQEDTADEARLERDLKGARELRRQAAKLTNIGINSGSDLLTSKAKQLKDRAARIEAAAKPVHRERAGEIRLATSGMHARVLLALDNVPVTTPEGRVLFNTGKLLVFQGDRIVLLGRNGAGKSQFIKLLHRAISGPDGVSGVKVTPSIVLGYADQDLRQFPPDATPGETIGRFGVGDARVRALLAGAGFSVEKQSRPIRELSLGQRARLGLLALRLAEPNFYLMDEPTNHVDIPGCEALEAEILAHEAGCVLVSHDRRFVRNVGSRFLVIVGSKLVEVDTPNRFFAELAAARADV